MTEHELKQAHNRIYIYTPAFMEDHRCCIYADMIKRMIKELNGGKIEEGGYIITITKEPIIGGE